MPFLAPAPNQNSADSALAPVSARSGISAKNTVIFILRGHDNTAQEQLEPVLMKLGFEPFIVPNSEAGGKALIEALEAKIAWETA